VLAAAVLWGTTGTAQVLAPAGTESVSIGAVRLALGGAALLAWAIAHGALPSLRGWSVPAVAIAAGSMATYQVCFFTGVAATGVAVGTIVAIGSAPILAGILGYLLRGERPGRRWGIATALAVMGCTLLVVVGSEVQVDPVGIVLACGAGAAYATYTVTSKRLLDDHPPDAVTAIAFSLGALFLVPLLFTAHLNWLAEPRGLAVALHLGLFATAAAYISFMRGLIVVPVATAVTLSLAEPLTAGLLGVFVLGERLAPPALLGVGLIVCGLVLLSFNTESGGET
jgi:DME family drug/metabolite transporter